MRDELTKLYISKRAGATFIDYSIVWVFAFFCVFQFGEPNNTGGYTLSGWPALIPMLFWFAYIVLSEQYLGATLGHMILKIKVDSVIREKITLWRTCKRRLADCVEIAWCFGLIAYLIARSTPNNQRLGDIIAKTCVIGKDDNYEELTFDFEKI